MLFATFGLAYRYAMWLKRPPTDFYWRRGWQVFFRRGGRGGRLGRLAGVPEAERLEAVARLLSEEGFLAEVVTDNAGRRLRLAHCPLRELVEVSRLPCRAELALVGELVGRPLQRESFIPDGAPSCTYSIGPAKPPRPHTTSTTRRRRNAR